MTCLWNANAVDSVARGRFITEIFTCSLYFIAWYVGSALVDLTRALKSSYMYRPLYPKCAICARTYTKLLS